MLRPGHVDPVTGASSMSYVIKLPTWVVGSLAAYGAGSLLGAVAFDLVPQADALPGLESAVWLRRGRVRGG